MELRDIQCGNSAAVYTFACSEAVQQIFMECQTLGICSYKCHPNSSASLERNITAASNCYLMSGRDRYPDDILRVAKPDGATLTALGCHPPSVNAAPNAFATRNKCRSVKRGPTAVKPMGKPFSPANPGMLRAGTCIMVQVEQKF